MARKKPPFQRVWREMELDMLAMASDSAMIRSPRASRTSRFAKEGRLRI